MAVARTSRSASSTTGATCGRILAATSMGLWYCCVAVRASSAALRAGGKGSLSARTKAAMSTLSRVPASMCAAILPRQMVVLVRMAASSSICSLAKARITCCIEAGLSLGARVTMLFTVSSRSAGLVSTKPMLTLAKRLSLTTLEVRYSTMLGRRSRRGMRMERSVLAKSLTTVGTTCSCISSSLSTLAMMSSGSRALAEPPPYSSELTSAGSTFHCAAGLGRLGTRSASFVKNRSFSTASLTLSVSRKSWSETYSSSKSGFCSISIGRSRPAGLDESRRM
mmetsp:Transcript_48481/g.116620  ORF Transcript_48481/g.116620 Transcript_48481/m.116620 type:complete len:281 (+) Transcript_48481:174-1016(+)